MYFSGSRCIVENTDSWNTLPTDCCHATSLTIFKIRCRSDNAINETSKKTDLVSERLPYFFFLILKVDIISTSHFSHVEFWLFKHSLLKRML